MIYYLIFGLYNWRDISRRKNYIIIKYIFFKYYTQPKMAINLSKFFILSKSKISFKLLLKIYQQHLMQLVSEFQDLDHIDGYKNSIS